MTSCNLNRVLAGLSEKQRQHVLSSLRRPCCGSCPVAPLKP